VTTRPRQKVTRAGIRLIAAFEGLRRRAARLPDGRWTIGYGHTLSAREGAEVSAEDAEALLHFDLLPIAEAVNSLVYTPLTQNQFDALVAFAYNVGIEAFRASDVLKRVNEGRLTEAACAIDLWRKADLNGDTLILDALIRRRAAEKALFLTPPDGFVPTPSPLVRPSVDETLAPALPQSRPTDIAVPMEGAFAEVHRVAPTVEASEEPVVITTSEAEAREIAPQPSEPVEATYSDDIPVETPQELEVQTLEAGEPGAEAMAPPEAQPAEAEFLDPQFLEPETLATGPIEPEVLAPEAPQAAEPVIAESPVIEGEAVEIATAANDAGPELQTEPGFPEAPPARPVEPAVEMEPEADFPVAEPAIPAAGAAAERIYAPEPDPVQPEPASIVGGGFPQPTVALDVAGPAVTTESEAPPSVWSLTPPPDVIETPPSRQDTAPPRPPLTDEEQAALFDAGEPDQDVAQRIIRYEELEGGDVVLDRPSTGPFILMGIIGLAAFGGAFAAFIKGQHGVGGATSLTGVAWTLALIGAACVGTSLYFLLKRLGGVDE
jgi:lysozyme